MHRRQIWTSDYGKLKRVKPHDTPRARKLDPDVQRFIREMYHRLINIGGLDIDYVGMPTYPRRGGASIQAKVLSGLIKRPISTITVTYMPSWIMDELREYYIDRNVQIELPGTDELLLYRNNYLVTKYPKMSSDTIKECVGDVVLLADWIRSDFEEEFQKDMEQAEL